jgi:NAD(P)-dependent dehydrogenase (short-subunit alcohol dehydrogenase family)
MKLSPGSVVVITGAASGIGEGLARECVQRGHRVALADIEGPALDVLADELTAAGGTIVSAVTDVADPDSVAKFAATVFDGLDVPDLVIANAGVVGPAVPLWEQHRDAWEWTWRVNQFGVVNTWTAFLPTMIERGTGHIVATSSVAGVAPGQTSGNTPYAATKYAVVALCDNLRFELTDVAPGIEVTALLPGPVRSRIWGAARNRPDAFGGPQPPPPPGIDPFPTRLEADEFAVLVLDGLERGPRYLLPNEDFVERIASHLDGVAAELRQSRSEALRD